MLSLVTYTYNDAPLTLALLASVADWRTRPDEIVVVDDGSRVPFVLPEDGGDAPVRTRLIRLPENLGPAGAKSAGLDAARGDLILSLDCDIRLPAGWLERAVPLATRPEVGVAGCPIVAKAGHSVVDRYLARFGGHGFEGRGEEPRPVEFVSGGVWLMRREVWERTGGFGDYRERTHEDHFFCRRAREAGLTLYMLGPEPAVQERRLNRRAMVKRHWLWLGDQEKGLVREKGDALIAMYSFLEKMAARLEQALQAQEPVFLYLETLYMAYAFLDILTHARTLGLDEPAPAACWAGLAAQLAEYPRLRAALRTDLTLLGAKLEPPAEAAEEASGAVWAEVFALYRPLAQAGFLRHLEERGVPLLLAEERALGSDFSFYETA